MKSDPEADSGGTTTKGVFKFCTTTGWFQRYCVWATATCAQMEAQDTDNMGKASLSGDGFSIRTCFVKLPLGRSILMAKESV